MGLEVNLRALKSSGLAQSTELASARISTVVYVASSFVQNSASGNKILSVLPAPFFGIFS